MAVPEGRDPARREGHGHEPATELGKRRPLQPVVTAARPVPERQKKFDRQDGGVGIAHRLVELAVGAVVGQVGFHPRNGQVDQLAGLRMILPERHAADAQAPHHAGGPVGHAVHEGGRLAGGGEIGLDAAPVDPLHDPAPLRLRQRGHQPVIGHRQRVAQGPGPEIGRRMPVCFVAPVRPARGVKDGFQLKQRRVPEPGLARDQAGQRGVLHPAADRIHDHKIRIAVSRLDRGAAGAHRLRHQGRQTHIPFRDSHQFHPGTLCRLNENGGAQVGQMTKPRHRACLQENTGSIK